MFFVSYLTPETTDRKNVLAMRKVTTGHRETRTQGPCLLRNAPLRKVAALMKSHLRNNDTMNNFIMFTFEQSWKKGNKSVGEQNKEIIFR